MRGQLSLEETAKPKSIFDVVTSRGYTHISMVQDGDGRVMPLTQKK